MMWRVLLLAMVWPWIAVAEHYTQTYTDVSLADLFKKRDAISATETIGLDVAPAEKLHFTARYLAAPVPCQTGLLNAALTTLGFPDMLKTIAVTHCIVLATEDGRSAKLYLQDVLVPGLEHDVKVGDKIDIHADLLGYEIVADRAHNQPVMMVSGFEPVAKT